MATYGEAVYARLLAAEGHTMLAHDLRRALGMTSDELNHAGDRLKRLGAVEITKCGTREWRWTAKPGIDVADRRGQNRAGVCSPHSRANLRIKTRAEREAEAAKLRERWRQDAQRPLRSRLRHILDISWANWMAAMKTGD